VNDVLIVGSSGHARVIVDIITGCGAYGIAGLIDDTKPEGSVEFDLPILGGVANLPEIVRKYQPRGYFVAVGDNWSRGLLVAKIEALAPELAAITVVHPGAQVSRTASLGDGVAVMAGAVISSNALVGRFCIVNTRASVDHDARLAEFASIGPGATLAGNVHVGAYSAICLNACVAEKLSVGPHTVAGAGSVVLYDLPDHVLAYGAPARVVRARREGDRYLR